MNSMEMKERLYRFLEPSPPDENRWEKSFDGFILALILLSVGAVILRTMQTLPESYSSFLAGFQFFATGVFTVEYLLRVYSCTAGKSYSHPVWGRIRFILSPMAIVDLMAVLPFILAALVAPGANMAEAALMLRMLRLLKLFRYSHSLIVFARVLRQKANQLIAAFFVTGVLLVFSSSLVYFAERGAQPEAFPSIPATMWWGIVTLTTVGYGDVSPVTPLGQLFGAITAVVGIGIVALPSGILASGFIEEFAEEEQTDDDREMASKKQCPHCGYPL
jgi:voltage-gated potassium channel